MKTEPTSPNKESDFAKQANASEPISLYPLQVDAAVAALLKVKLEPKPEK